MGLNQISLQILSSVMGRVLMCPFLNRLTEVREHIVMIQLAAARKACAWSNSLITTTQHTDKSCEYTAVIMLFPALLLECYCEIHRSLLMTEL
jgi:hypothetical protein